MLEFSDGCVKTNVITQIYPLAPAGVVYVSGQGAFGTPAVEVQPNKTLPIQTAQDVTRIDQFWFSFGLLATTTSIIWQAYDSVGAQAQVYLQLNSSNVLQLLRGVTVIATGPTLVVNTQYNFEIKTTIDATVGLVAVYLNGNGTPVINFSGNTKTTANTWTDQVRFGPPENAGGYNQLYSHIAIYNTTGAAPNALIGLKRIYTLDSGGDSATGGLNVFSTSPAQAAGSHYLNVDDEPPDADTSYNFDTTIGDRESYRVAGLPSGVTGIIVVNAFAMLRIDAGGSHSSNIVARNGTTDTVGAAQFLSATYAYYNQPFPLDPNTGSSWTLSGFGSGTLSNAEFGIEIAS